MGYFNTIVEIVAFEYWVLILYICDAMRGIDSCEHNTAAIASHASGYFRYAYDGIM